MTYSSGALRLRRGASFGLVAACAVSWLVACSDDNSNSKTVTLNVCQTACSSNSDCPSNLPACSEGKCVECLNDGDCKGVSGRPYCNKVNKECAQCAKDAHCTTGLKKCHALGACRQCDTDADCPPNGPRCERTSGLCARCSTDADCKNLKLPPGFPLGTKCGPVETYVGVNVCMPCVKDSDCSDQRFKKCKLDEWGTRQCIGCKTDAECCKGSGPCPLKCDVATATCTCTADAECMQAKKGAGGRWKCAPKKVAK